MSKKNSIHVIPSATTPGKFVNKVEGNPKPISRPATQSESIKKAISIAKERGGEVVIHRRDGTVREADSYGNGPNPSRDRKH
jgi:hypothetical protein